MRSFLSIVFIFCAVGTGFSQHRYCSKYKHATAANRLIIDDFRSDTFDIVHTSIRIDTIDQATRYIAGNALLSIGLKQNAPAYLNLDLEGLTVDSVRSVAGNAVSSFSVSDQKIHLLFQDSWNEGDSIQLQVFYRGNPITDESGWGGFYFQGGYAWNLGVGFQADPHSYGRVWFPCFDNFIEKSSFDFHVRVSNGRRASCNGILLSASDNGDGTSTYHWNQPEPISSYLVNIAVANYTVVNDEVEGTFQIPVQLHARASDTNNLKASFIHLEDAVLAFEESYGPYRFSKVGYSLVPFGSGAMEHAANITYPIYAANGTLDDEALMAHELAHMWWGDNVTCETDGDMWINEGWASFSEFLFEEAVYGRDAYESAMQADLRFMLQFGHHYEEFYRPVSGQPHEYVYGDHVYKKGALVAHNLRAYMGDEAFFNTIDAFMDHFQYQAVSSDSMERFFSDYASLDLSYFFRDWIFSGGYNVIVLDSFSYQAEGADYKLTMHLQQKLKGREAFHDNSPVYYAVYNAAGEIEEGEMILISGQYETVTVNSSLEPSRVVLFPKHEMAAARTRDEISITSPGTQNLANTFWKIDINNVTDTGWAMFDHIWSKPDPFKQWDTKAYTMSTYHYYEVFGPGVEGADLSAEFFYNGNTGSSAGFLDIEFLAFNEDSLVFLHRASKELDWEEYPHADINTLGATDDAFGQIKLTKVLPGEYVLAARDVNALGVTHDKTAQFKVFPNPADDSVNIVTDLNGDVQFQLYDLKGAEVKSGKLNTGKTVLNTSELSAGQYTLSISRSGQVLETQRVILN